MDILTYALAKSYTDKALLGVGTIKGAPCTVKSQTEDDEYVYVTLGWENNLGTSEETVVKIKKGADGAPGEPGPAGDPGPQGISITKIEKIKTEDLIDTYQISFSDNTTFEYTISNGSTDYLKITNKPSIEGVELIGNKTFEDLNIASADALAATDENLQNLSNLIGDKTSLPAPTDTIVNNIASVDAKVDAIIDDNEAGLAKTFSSDKITKTFATKEEIPTVPNKVSELTNDSNYQTAEQVNSTVTTEIAKIVADAPEDLNTLKEMSDWIAGHEDDASAMNSAISDNKTAITALQTGKADKSEIPTTLPANGGNSDTVNNHNVESDVPTDAVFTDTIYDDTEVKESIGELNSNLVDRFKYASGDSNVNYEVIVGKFVASNGTVQDNIDFNMSRPIKVYKGLTAVFYGRGYNTAVSMISTCDSNGNSIQPKVLSTDSSLKEYRYTIEEDGYILLSWNKSYDNNLKLLTLQNESLETLEYGEVAGGNNIIGENVRFTKATSWDDSFPPNNTIDINAYFKNGAIKTKYEVDDWVIIPFHFKNGVKVNYATFKDNAITEETSICICNSTNKLADITSAKTYTPTSTFDGYICIGKHIKQADSYYPMLSYSAITIYEPYIPSVKMLAEENAQQSTEAMDLKMLGWTVPSECPVQNYMDSDGVFHQKVGRVDLGSLTWIYETELNRFAALLPGKFKPSNQNEWTRGLYCVLYEANPSPIVDDKVNMTISGYSDDEHLYLHNFSYTDATTFKTAMQGVYLYYELATPITMTIDGNEVTERINESLSVIGKCKNLLNPILKTTTVNGVTCTDNGDGTYTLNGTATEKADFSLFTSLAKYQHLKNKTVKLVGCPKGGSDTTYRMYLQLQKHPYPGAFDKGEGSSVTVDNNNNWECWIRIFKDVTVSNLTFKPMITENLNATYDDFVPYTGDGDTLTADVAELKNDLDTLELSEIAGGKNLFDGKIIVGEGIYAYAKLPKSNVHISISDRDINVDISNISFGLSNTVVPDTDTMNWAFVNNGTIVGRDSNDFINSSFTAKSLSIFPNDANTVTKILQRFNIQIEEGTTATDYEPYIPSVKMLAEEVNQQNESLEEYGLLNKVTEMQQGRWNISSGVFEDGEYYVSSKESISCNGNSNIKLKCDNAEAFDIVFFNGSSFISGESKNGSELLFTTPSNATLFKFNIYNGNQLTPQNIGKIEVYVDSQIEQLKNDLDKLSSLPIGSIIQIDADKDDTETTTQKYGWQYLGTSNIQYENGSANILVTNVYRKNN